MKNTYTNRHRQKRQRGISMLEVLVAIVVCSLMGLAIASSAAFSLKNQKYTEIGNLARNLAVSKVEEISGIPTGTLGDANDSTENQVTIPGIGFTFKRVTNITVNSDQSRKIDVLVTVNDTRYSKFRLDYSTTFAMWE